MLNLAKSIELMRGELAENTRKIDQVLKGFPSGDTDGHRRFHEEVIQQMADRRRIRQELLSHLLKASTWAALTSVVYALWKHFRNQFMG